MLMNAWLHDLYQILGIFVPLIITNCAIIARAEIFASRNKLLPSIIDGLATGAGFALVLCALGGARELIGQGTLLANAQLLFGEGARNWQLGSGEHYRGMLVALLPPGAFILLGLMLAMKNALTPQTDTGADTSREQ